MTGPDVVTGGRPERRVRRPAPRWLVPVLVLAVVAGVGADRWQLRRETSALRRCVNAGDGTVQHTDRRIASVVEYVSPQLTRADTRPELRRSLGQLVQATARDGLAPLARAQQRCAGVHVLPWHQEALEARRAVLAYLVVCREHLLAVTTDLDVLGQPDARRALARQRVRGLSP